MKGRHNTQASCFRISFTRKPAAPLSTKRNISEYLQAVHGLTPAEAKAELFYLTDNEARSLKYLFKPGLRGTDITKVRRTDKDSYETFLNKFLFANNSFEHYFHEVFAILLKSNMPPHDVFQLLLSFHQQEPERVKQRFDYHLTVKRQTLQEVCELYKGKTEDEALEIGGTAVPSYKF